MTFRENLLDASYEGVKFPVSEAETETSHDLARHKAYRRPGADLEPLGLNEDSGTLVIPLFNDLDGFRGVDMYPGRYRRLLDVIRTTPIGRLVHPTRGSIRAAVVVAKEKLLATQRNGIVLSLAWVEHTPSSGAVARTVSAEAAYARLDDYDTAAATAGLVAAAKAEQLRALLDEVQSVAATGLAVLATIRALQTLLAEIRESEEMGLAANWPVVRSLAIFTASVNSLADVYAPDVDATRRFVLPATMSATDAALLLYGDARRADLLLKANRLPDPTRIREGTALTVPPAPKA